MINGFRTKEVVTAEETVLKKLARLFGNGCRDPRSMHRELPGLRVLLRCRRDVLGWDDAKARADRDAIWHPEGVWAAFVNC